MRLERKNMIKIFKKYSFIIRQIYIYATKKTKHYYDGKQKTGIHIFIDLLRLLVREKEFCSLYFALGFDQKDSDVSKYMGKKGILHLKEKAEQELKVDLGTELCYDAITKDKFYAGSILKANNMPVLMDIALISCGQLYISGKGICSFEQILSLGNNLVIKNVILEASEGVFFVDIIDDSIFIDGVASSIFDLQNRISNSAWVVQKKYKSHSEIMKFNESALNVMRVTTVFDGSKVSIIGGFQAFATGDAKTDSWSDGSIYVGVDFYSGCFQKHGFRSPWHEGLGLLCEHPDTGIKFENHPIPFIEEIKKLCLSAHRLFYTNFLLGWDIAITETGPMIVEVNEKPGMNILQCVDKNTIIKLLESYRNLEKR